MNDEDAKELALQTFADAAMDFLTDETIPTPDCDSEAFYVWNHLANPPEKNLKVVFFDFAVLLEKEIWKLKEILRKVTPDIKDDELKSQADYLCSR